MFGGFRRTAVLAETPLAHNPNPVYFLSRFIHPIRRALRGTHLSLLLFRPAQAAILGLWPGRQACAGFGSRRARPRSQLGLGRPRLVRALPRLRAGLARPRQQRLGARRHLQRGRARSRSFRAPRHHRRFPVRLIGHSLGGGIVLHFCGVYPARARKAVSIEGLGFPQEHRVHGPASERVRHWIETIRELEKRRPKSYPNIEAAIARMKEVNPRLTDQVARHLTLHGTNWESDGSLLWKFDNYARAISPYGHHMEDAIELFSQITNPVLFFWGLESFLPVPEDDPRYQAIRQRRLIKVPNAGHWVHHDQLQPFLEKSTSFLAD